LRAEPSIDRLLFRFSYRTALFYAGPPAAWHPRSATHCQHPPSCNLGQRGIGTACGQGVQCRRLLLHHHNDRPRVQDDRHCHGVRYGEGPALVLFGGCGRDNSLHWTNAWLVMIYVGRGADSELREQLSMGAPMRRSFPEGQFGGCCEPPVRVAS
jgi:hypothetical protein